MAGRTDHFRVRSPAGETNRGEVQGRGIGVESRQEGVGGGGVAGVEDDDAEEPGVVLYPSTDDWRVRGHGGRNVS